jgi:hypothetical protein
LGTIFPYNRRLALDVPRNALRHSIGSYHYALHRNENLTAAERAIRRPSYFATIVL